MSRMNWMVVGAICFVAACVEPSEEPDSTDLVSQGLSDNGPFTNQQALVAYWTIHSDPSIATVVFLNGKVVFSHDGFGPALAPTYFTCQAGNIYAVCPTGWVDGFRDFATLAARIPAAAGIRKDGVIVRTTTPGSQIYNVKTCPTQSTLYGFVSYYRVTSIDNDFSPPYVATCYPL